MIIINFRIARIVFNTSTHNSHLIQDVLFCPAWFEEHADKGKSMEQNLVADHFEYNITPDELRQIETNIDRHIEDQVDERNTS